MDSLKIKAYAKINLGLDVVRRLENGYHQVRMVMQTVDICDILTCEKTGAGICITTDSPDLPTDESNLIHKAVRLMRERYDIKEGVRVHLEKRIPIAAGMAGGSADAAAALKGMSQLFGLGCSLEELQEIGVHIGADVPYCLMGGTALAEGIGEKLTALPAADRCFLLIAKPDISVSTKYVYEHLDETGVSQHPDIDGMAASIRKGSRHGWVKYMGNVLESVTVSAYPVIDLLKKRMRELGAENSLMSGSGPTVYGVFEQEKAVQEAYSRMKEDGLAKQLFVTTMCDTPWEEAGGGEK